MALRAIANSGFSEAYAEVTAHLTAGDDATRVAAVRALQSMRENDVDGSLETRFHVDQSAEVRSAVLEVFRLRPVTGTVRRVAGEALSDVSAHVRYTALALVEHLMPEHPKIRPLVATVASNDPEAKIRLRATAILATDGVATTVIP